MSPYYLVSSEMLIFQIQTQLGLRSSSVSDCRESPQGSQLTKQFGIQGAFLIPLIRCTLARLRSQLSRIDSPDFLSLCYLGCPVMANHPHSYRPALSQVAECVAIVPPSPSQCRVSLPSSPFRDLPRHARVLAHPIHTHTLCIIPDFLVDSSLEGLLPAKDVRHGAAF